MRIETIGDATLYCADCRDVLPTLSGVDAVVTDPPYGIDYQSARRTDKNSRLPKIVGDLDLDFMPVVMRECYRLCSENSHAYVFCRWDKWPLDVAPWTITNMVVWDKLQHGTGDLDNSFGPQHEIIAFLTKGRRGFSDKRPTDILRCPKVQPLALVHSCEKPIGLLEYLLRLSSLSGDIVLDPFMGSGTTGVACARLGRKFIGIEIEEKYFSIACRRIEEAYRQADLFISRPRDKAPETPDMFA